MIVYIANVKMLSQIIQLWETYQLIEPEWEINRFQMLELIISDQLQLSYPNEQDEMQQRLINGELFLVMFKYSCSPFKTCRRPDN